MESLSVARLRQQAELLVALSILHLTSETRTALADDNLSVNAYPTGCGGFVYVDTPRYRVPAEPDLATIFEAAKRAGVASKRRLRISDRTSTHRSRSAKLSRRLPCRRVGSATCSSRTRARAFVPMCSDETERGHSDCDGGPVVDRGRSCSRLRRLCPPERTFGRMFGINPAAPVPR